MTNSRTNRTRTIVTRRTFFRPTARGAAAASGGRCARRREPGRPPFDSLRYVGREMTDHPSDELAVERYQMFTLHRRRV